MTHYPRSRVTRRRPRLVRSSARVLFLRSFVTAQRGRGGGDECSDNPSSMDDDDDHDDDPFMVRSVRDSLVKRGRIHGALDAACGVDR